MHIRTALVSVYDKSGLEPLIQKLHSLGIKLISTGGTYDFIKSLGFEAFKVEEMTGYPSIFGGRVKTLHPVIFGGILHRRESDADAIEMKSYNIPPIDMVIVDLYPFEKTVASGASSDDIIEKIDIGGISLIRAAAKNYRDVLIVPSRDYYGEILDLLNQGSRVEEATLRYYASQAFEVTAHYDKFISAWFSKAASNDRFFIEASPARVLRYGENPHQAGYFYGDLEGMISQVHGKELSYNNLLDIDAAINLILEFDDPTIAILKHNNACGLASRPILKDAWEAALAADPVSAFGGIIASNKAIDSDTAQGIDTIFCEVVIAPAFDDAALEILSHKKNRILIILKHQELPTQLVRSALNGILVQERDNKVHSAEDLKPVTRVTPSPAQLEDLIFANIIVKHTKSNAIVLSRNRQLLGSGTGQTSRVDALRQAITKAQSFGFDLKGAVMASDAYFPFADSVMIAHQAGISAVIQPGGSIRDQESIDFCEQNGIAMVFTGIRHFKH